MKVKFGLVFSLCFQRGIVSISKVALWIYFCLQFGCSSSEQFKPMTLGYTECELIFSAHDRCKGVPENLELNLGFRADHTGISFEKDNISITQKDFSMKDIRGCLHTPEFRISFRVKSSSAPDFTWTILNGEETWAEYTVKIQDCGT